MRSRIAAIVMLSTVVFFVVSLLVSLGLWWWTGDVARGVVIGVICGAAAAISPWLNPIEMLWRHFRREVTHCELFPNIKALIAAAYDFFDRYNRCPWQVLSIIGSDPAEIT
jgi:hypothetical protein